MTRLNQAASIIVSGLVISISSCTGDHKSKQSGIDPEALPEDIVELRDDQIKLADVALGSVEQRSMGKIIKANGIVSVEPRNLATVCMPLGGYVRYTSLVPGNRVNKGQTLAVIENQEFVDIQQHYLEARNKLLFAEEDYNRHTELYKDDIYSEQNVQQVTVEYRNLKAQTRSLEQKLRYIGIDPVGLREDNISSSVNLVSPITGFLKAVNINIGKYVTQTDVLFEIVNSDKLLLELTLFEKDASGISAGQKLKFFINDETEEHDAVITQTAGTVSDDKTFRAYAAVLSRCHNILPGMYVNAYIEESDSSVTSLPSEAVVSFDDKDYIFTFEKEKEEAGKPFTEYRMVEVKKGASGSGFTQIMLPAGFDAGSVKVVIRGAYNLLSAKKNAGEMAC